MPGQAPEIDGVCYINNYDSVPPASGQLRKLVVTEAHDYDLVGSLTDEILAQAPAAARPDLFSILTGNRPEASRPVHA
jgi:ribosomal protein S12 methylthiotransferase